MSKHERAIKRAKKLLAGLDPTYATILPWLARVGTTTYGKPSPLRQGSTVTMVVHLGGVHAMPAAVQASSAAERNAWWRSHGSRELVSWELVCAMHTRGLVRVEHGFVTITARGRKTVSVLQLDVLDALLAD